MPCAVCPPFDSPGRARRAPDGRWATPSPAAGSCGGRSGVARQSPVPPTEIAPLKQASAHPSTRPDAPSGGIEAQGLACRYVGEPVLRGVDFALRPPQTVAIVGVNGAGKSSLIKVLLGLLPLAGGAACIDGHAVGTAASRSALAFLPERFLPPQHLTGGEFLRFARRLYGGPTVGRAEVEARMLAMLDLDPGRLTERVGALSKGMAQKLGLVAVLSSGRPLLVLDEPFSGLDPLAREALLEGLNAHRAAGGSVLYTSHALADVPRLAERLLVLHEGTIRFDGAPAELCTSTGHATLEAAWVACVRAPARA